MKTSAKILCSLMILLTLFSVTPQIAVFAADQDGISLSVETDKESYESHQKIDVTVTVKNTNDYTIDNVSVTVELPEGLSLVSGDLSISDITLQPGDTYQRAMKAMKSTATDPTGSTSSTTEPTSATEPTKPTWPTLPTEPTQQLGPVKPTAPTKPTSPTDSNKPTVPTRPTTSVRPTTPATQKTIQPSNNENDSNQVNPKTGELSLMPFMLIMMITAIIAAAALAAIRKHQYQVGSVISLVLILSLAFSMAPIHVLAAKAEDT
ncbi:MAG: hypothetical protein IIY93_10535, partial [Clostridia bacterium]|nr:hypothetical protein [Clostridia bacterium]